MMRFHFPAAVAASLAAAATAQPLSAQIQLDRFYPPVVAVGQPATIKAEGEFPQWPVQVDHDRAEIAITAGDAAGEFRVEVPPDSPPGIVWVRCFDDQSASGLVPLLIEPVAVTAETEPNDALSEAAEVQLPAALAGRLAKRGDVDAFRVTAQSGQTLVASVIAHRPLGSPMDAVLQIADAQGNVLAQSDDQRGLDPQIVYPVTRDGDLWVRIFAFPETATSTIGFAGEDSYLYVIRATTGPFVDHVLPLMAGDSQAAGQQAFGWNLPAKFDLAHAAATDQLPQVAFVRQTLGWQWQTAPPDPTIEYLIEPPATTTIAAATAVAALPVVFSGHIAEAGEVDALRFPVASGQTYRAEVRSRAAGLPLDSLLRVFDPATQQEVARNDDATQSVYDAAIEFTAKADAPLELQISDLVDAAGPRHAYSVWVGQAPPDFALTVTADRFALKAGETQEMSVAVERLRRFDAQVQIAAAGLPAGVHAEPVVSEPKGDTAKAVKLKLTADAAVAFQGPLQIIGTVLDAEGQPGDRTRLATHALTDGVRSGKLWLTVVNQKAK